MKPFLQILLLIFVPLLTYSQANANGPNPWSYELVVLILLAAVASLILLIIVVLLLHIYVYIGNEYRQKNGLSPQSFWEFIFNDFNKKYITGELLPVHEQDTILLPHTYDGIRELNNGMPPWLRFIFTFTIVFGVAYMTYYFVLDMGDLQIEEYNKEIAQAAIDVENYTKKMTDAIDENNAKILLNDAKVISSGKDIYLQNCMACHGAAGEGGVGPNLTDEYWIHGNTMKDIYKTIKNGVPEKGMISWKQKLRPVDIQNVSNYILSIQGTNPPNAKAPQGNKI